MAILLEIHSILRWVIVIVGLIATVKFLIGWAGKSEFGRMDRGLSSGFSGLIDLQVTLGLLYFLITGFGGVGFPMFRIEHTVTMLLAATAGHAPAMFKKASNKFAVALGAILVALLLVYLGVMRLPGGWSRNDLGFVFVLFSIIVPIVMIAVLVVLVKKTKEEEQAVKVEIRQLLLSLPRESHAAFMIQYNSQMKNPTTAVVLALLLGGLGIHKFYLGQTGVGIVYLLFSWTFIPAFVGFIEAFTISKSVHSMNRKTAREAAAMLG